MPKEIDGVPLCRVTEICNLVKPVDPLITAAIKVTLEKGNAEAWDEYTKQAMQDGTDVHAALENAVKNVPNEDKRDIVEKCLSGFQKWMDDFKVTVEYSEVELTHHYLCYTGTCDLVCMIDGKRYIADFKTSKSIYDGYDMQVAAYACAWDYLHGDKKIDGIGVLRLDKDTGEYEWKDFTNRRLRAEDAFRSLLSFFYGYKDRRMSGNPRVEAVKSYYKRKEYFHS